MKVKISEFEDYPAYNAEAVAEDSHGKFVFDVPAEDYSRWQSVIDDYVQIQNEMRELYLRRELENLQADRRSLQRS